jgi:hypothetical protein
MLDSMYDYRYMYVMNTLQQQFLRQLADLWPLAKGSLAEVRQPCIRPNCPRCRRGQKHPRYIFSCTSGGRRRCLHVPRSLVPLLRQAIRNQRQLEKLLANLGPALLQAHRPKN